MNTQRTSLDWPKNHPWKPYGKLHDPSASHTRSRRSDPGVLKSVLAQGFRCIRKKDGGLDGGHVGSSKDDLE
jgi:hypothetical protein